MVWSFGAWSLGRCPSGNLERFVIQFQNYLSHAQYEVICHHSKVFRLCPVGTLGVDAQCRYEAAYGVIPATLDTEDGCSYLIAASSYSV